MKRYQKELEVCNNGCSKGNDDFSYCKDSLELLIKIIYAELLMQV